ncbi:hypothetical protein ACS15_3488 [Ralstonia insidiosa]|uniref:Uncharacterized protein n=1 Tax=Ralstonia insidiosa TaxID=190721 RepID=A0AAC9FTP4_9RALS|nr:hypothetical protein ACS15_3488 [Ralstonia insidiosa]
MHGDVSCRGRRTHCGEEGAQGFDDPRSVEVSIYAKIAKLCPAC